MPKILIVVTSKELASQSQIIEQQALNFASLPLEAQLAVKDSDFYQLELVAAKARQEALEEQLAEEKRQHAKTKKVSEKRQEEIKRIAETVKSIKEAYERLGQQLRRLKESNRAMNVFLWG